MCSKHPPRLRTTFVFQLSVSSSEVRWFVWVEPEESGVGATERLAVLFMCLPPSPGLNVLPRVPHLAIVRPADGKKGESPPSFTRNGLLKCCARLCVRESRLLRMLGISQGNGCHRNGHWSVLCYHSNTAGGGGGGEWWTGDLGGRGRMEEGGRMEIEGG